MSKARNNVIKLNGLSVDAKEFGAKGDGVTDDTTAMQAALTYAVSNYLPLYIPPGTYLLTANLTAPLPSNLQKNIAIVGAGRDGVTVLRFSGAAVTTGLTLSYTPSSYQYVDKISDLSIVCVSGAKRGMTVEWTSNPIIERVSVNGATEIGANFTNCNALIVRDLFALNNGSASYGQVEVDACTAVNLESLYIATGRTGCRSGLRLDQCVTASVSATAIESCGIPIEIASKSTAGYVACYNVKLDSLNLENSGGTSYIKVGYGFSAGYSAYSLTMNNIRGSVSGSTTVVIGADLNRVLGLTSTSCYFGLQGSPTATYNFNSTVNIGAIIFPVREMFGATYPWVKVNGTQDTSATPLETFELNKPRAINQNSAVITASTASVSASPLASQGGIFGVLQLQNASPQTINTIAEVPLTTGPVVQLLALNSNTTIAHQTGGAGGFTLLGGASRLLQDGNVLTVFYNGNTGYWTECGSVDSVQTITASAAAIAAIGNAINTTNKVAGKVVWDTTNNRNMRASGSAAADVWWVVDGSTSVTPV